MPIWLAVLVVIVVAFAIAGVAWTVMRREQTRVGFLLATSQALLEARDLNAATVDVLRRASVRFGADCAELTLLPETSTGAGFRTTVRAGEPIDVMRSTDLEDDDVSLRPPIYGVIHIAEAATDPWVTRLCSRLATSRGLAVTLRHGSRTVGFLALGMRASDTRESRNDDDQLQEFANQVALTIERSRLHDGLVRLAVLQSELADRAFHDPLTELANRALFIDRTERALLERDPERHVVSVVSVDLEDFRRINSEHGRAAGDAVLVEVARRLYECLRRTDTAARLGGDEFALLLTEVLHPREAELIAQRVVEALATPVSIEGATVSFKASVGLACASAEEPSAQALLRKATAAAKEAREAGSGTYRIHGGSTAGSADATLAEELESALNKGELVVHYQPIVELRTGIILGAEALVRWQHPVQGLIGPLNFLPVAVERGMIERIEDYVMRTACDQLKRWQTAYPATPELAMSINVSAGELVRGTVVDRVTRCLARVDVDPSCVILEFTENAVLQDLHGSIATFDALQRAGVHVAIDDVGTGYTSLAYLRRLPIDILKIARPLVAELGDPNSTGELARTVVHHSEALRLALVAEGVELPLQVKRLNELGCAMAQGYHLARPCDVDAMEALLSKGGLDPAVFGRVTPAKGAPAAVAPAKMAAAKVAPAKAAPAKAVPAKVAAAMVAPTQTPAEAAPALTPAEAAPALAPAEAAPAAAPANVAPAKVALADAAPAAAPAKVALPKAAPAKAAPAKAAPANAFPAAAPAKVALADAAPAAAPVNVAPAQAAPPKAVPANAAPAEAPAKVAPAEAPAKVALADAAPAAAPAKVALAKTAASKLAPAKVAPAKRAPVKRAPAKVAAAKAVTAKAVTAKAAPAEAPVKAALGKTVPAAAAAKVALAQAAPAKAVPAKAVQAKAVPAQAVPAKAVPAKAVPAKAVPANAAPVEAPAKAALAEAAASKGAAAKVAPAKTAASKRAATKAAPAKAAPAKATPAKATLAKTAPAKAVPAKAVPAKAVPAKAVTAKAVPATAKAALVKTAPAKAAPAKRAPVNRAAAKATPTAAVPAAAPAKTIPAKAAGTKTAPAKRTPVKRTPVKRAPARPTPAKVGPEMSQPARSRRVPSTGARARNSA